MRGANITPHIAPHQISYIFHILIFLGRNKKRKRKSSGERFTLCVICQHSMLTVPTQSTVAGRGLKHCAPHAPRMAKTPGMAPGVYFVTCLLGPPTPAPKSSEIRKRKREMAKPKPKPVSYVAPAALVTPQSYDQCMTVVIGVDQVASAMEAR